MLYYEIISIHINKIKAFNYHYLDYVIMCDKLEVIFSVAVILPLGTFYWKDKLGTLQCLQAV